MFIVIFLAVLTALVIGLGMLKYRRRSLAENISSILVITVSAVVACLVTKLVAGTLGDVAMGFISESEDLSETFAQLSELPNTAALIPIFISMLIAPVLFIVVMPIVRGLLSIGGYFAAKGIAKIHRSLGKPQLAINLCLAVIGGLLIVSIYTSPVIGLVNVTHNVVAEMPEEVKEWEDQPFDLATLDSKFLAPASDSVLTKTVHFCGGKPVYNALTTYKLDGASISLKNEVGTVSTAVMMISDLSAAEFEDYGQKEADTLRQVDDLFSDSPLLCVVGSEILGGLSDAWLEGRPFLGFECPETETYATGELMTGALMIFKGTDVESFPGDIGALTEALAVMTEKGLISAFMQEDSDIMELIGREGLIDAVLMSLYDNEPAHPLLAAILNVFTDVMADQIGIYTDEHAARISFAHALADLTDDGLTVDELSVQIIILANSYSVEWTSDQCKALAASMYDHPYVGGDSAMLVSDAYLSAAPLPAPVNSAETDPFLVWLDSVMGYVSPALPEPVCHVITRADIRIGYDQIDNVSRDNMLKLTNQIHTLLDGTADGADNALDLIGATSPVLDVLVDITAPKRESDTSSETEDKTVAENFMVGALQSNMSELMSGMEPDEAAAVTDTITILVGSIVDHKKLLTEEEYKEETKAIASIVSVITHNEEVDSDTHVGIFDNSEGTGVMETTADELVNKVVDSVILTQTLVESKEILTEAELPIRDYLTETDVIEVKAAIESAKAENIDRVEAIAVLELLFGV